jgi:hypothetical protein
MGVQIMGLKNYIGDRELYAGILDTITSLSGDVICSHDIMVLYAIRDSVARPVTRAVVKDMMRTVAIEQGVCIGATGKGYYHIQTEQELGKYIAMLRKHIRGTEERINIVKRGWRAQQKVKRIRRLIK